MERPADDLVVLLVGSPPERVEALRSAIATAGAHIVVEGAIDTRTALGEPPACDCLVVELPVDGSSLAALRAAAWSGDERVPVVPFTTDGHDATAFDVAAVSADGLGNLVDPIVRAVDAATASEPPETTGEAMIAATTDVLLAVTPGGTIQYVSPAVEDMVGVTASAVENEPLLAYVHPDDRTEAVEQLQRPTSRESSADGGDNGGGGSGGGGGDADSGRSSNGTETGSRATRAGQPTGPIRFGNGDGEWERVRLERRTLLGSSPQDGAVVLVRPAASVAGRPADEDAHAHMLHAAVDPMCFIHVDGTILAVNDALASFLGRDRDAVVGTNVSTIIGEDQYEAGFEVLSRRLEALSNRGSGTDEPGEADGTHEPGDADETTVVETDGVDELEGSGPVEQLLEEDEDGVSYEFVLERGDEEMWCEALLTPVVDDGVVHGSVGLLRDITDRKEREQQLLKYETIAEDTPIALFTFDEEATITWTNDVYPAMLELDREDVVGRPFPDLIAAGYYDTSVTETYGDAVRTLLSSKNDVEQESLELEISLPSGKTLVHEVYISLLPLDDGEFQGTIIAFRDITEQRTYERELERQNERLDAFTSVVSHDLRNPIAIADGYLEMALEDEDLGHVAEARKAIDRMESLVEQLLVLSREGRAVEEPVSVELEAVARDAWATVDTGDATLEIAGSKTVLADRSRLQQALENLFRNAVEHGSRGRGNRGGDDDGDGDGDGSGADRPVTVRVEVAEDGSGFAVADDGVGVPTENVERVFERGFTTNPDGTGFGLDIVKTIVEAHGWRIDLGESAAGGARFEIDTSP